MIFLRELDFGHLSKQFTTIPKEIQTPYLLDLRCQTLLLSLHMNFHDSILHYLHIKNNKLYTYIESNFTMSLFSSYRWKSNCSNC